MEKTENELIAEFMGWKKNDWGYWVSSFNGAHFDVCELQYHKSWDWLRPVIEKIESYRLAYPTEARKVLDFKIVVGMKYLYPEIIEFIKWFNTQKS